MKRWGVVAWDNESHLCDWLMTTARARGVKCYPEVVGWDVLMVTPADLRIGVEAKMRHGVEVIAQAMRRHHDRSQQPKPDVAVILVPDYSPSFRAVCERIGIETLRPADWSKLSYETEEWNRNLSWNRWWRRIEKAPRRAGKRLEPPAFEHLEGKAGCPSPGGLTAWRIKAIRLCNRLRETDVTRAEIEAYGLSPTYWTQHILEPCGKSGRKTIYRLRSGVELPDKGYEQVAEEMRTTA